MNQKISLTAKILFAITCLISLGFAEHLMANGMNQKAMGKSFLSFEQSDSPRETSSELQAVLDKAVTDRKIPGAVMYVSNSEGEWLGASGVRDKESKTRMKTTDGFSIASMSKTFGAVVVLKLVEDKKIDLDKTIATYLPKEVSPHIVNSSKITVRQLLNHTSGVAEYLATEDFKQATAKRSRSQPWTASEAVKYMYDAKPQAAPGEKFIYTDSNYILLELIVEKTTGGTLAQAIRSRILKPLDLKNTFTELREPIIGEVATGYGHRNKDGKTVSFADVNDGNGLGDGGLVSNAEDLAKFSKALFAKKTLLSPKMLKEMLTFKNNSVSYSYGLGVERFPTPYGNAFGHTGTAYGFLTIMEYVPSKDTTVIVLMNNQDNDVKAIAMKALDVVNTQ
ncbi:MAG: serine hydrolase [Rhizonema sp. PD38]|nr:serine hydrolase [Rhizonema sp. PD38]